MTWQIIYSKDTFTDRPGDNKDTSVLVKHPTERQGVDSVSHHNIITTMTTTTSPNKGMSRQPRHP